MISSLIDYIVITFFNSGTEKQHVADDYAKRLHIGEAECNEVVAAALNSLVSKDKDKMDFHFCEYLNISACPSSESGNVRHYVIKRFLRLLKNSLIF